MLTTTISENRRRVGNDREFSTTTGTCNRTVPAPRKLAAATMTPHNESKEDKRREKEKPWDRGIAWTLKFKKGKRSRCEAAGWAEVRHALFLFLQVSKEDGRWLAAVIEKRRLIAWDMWDFIIGMRRGIKYKV